MNTQKISSIYGYFQYALKFLISLIVFLKLPLKHIHLSSICKNAGSFMFVTSVTNLSSLFSTNHFEASNLFLLRVETFLADFVYIKMYMLLTLSCENKQKQTSFSKERLERAFIHFRKRQNLPIPKPSLLQEIYEPVRFQSEVANSIFSR